jgi:hypothetical protein
MRDARSASALFAALALAPCALAADVSWTVPGIVNAAGLNGTHFVSDLTVTNPGAAPAHATISFFPGTSGPKDVTLNPGQTVVYSDVAGVTFGISGGAGALSISSDQPLLIRAKTYNTAASGTYGVALPVVTSDRLLSLGDVADSLWITQDASGAAGYRTNVAVVFPDEEGGEAAVTVYDADGNEMGSQAFSMTAPGLQQFSVTSFAGAVTIGRAQVHVIRGTAAAYAVVVDNITGDSALFAFEQLPAGWQDVLVNGVARANGRNGAFFRTDGRFYNPTDTDATIQVSFHANQNANPSPVTSSFVLPAGKIRDVVDVLDSLLGLPVGSAGALRFTSNSPIAILCRTSNVDPSGARPGTFGSQQKPVPLLSFVNSADAGAAVTRVRQDAAFRTNVGFAAGADGASYTLTLHDSAGTTVATTSASLGAFGWTQPGIQDLFPTTTIPQNATLNVKVTQGSVDVFDSSIDNLSGDPVVTPIATLPASIPSSATIGPAGGSIRSDDGVLTLKIPAGALSAPTQFSIATVANDAPGALGSAYDVSPGGLALAKPALLSLRYGVAGIPVTGIDGVSVAVRGDTSWGGLTGGRVDASSRSLLVSLRNTSPWLAVTGTRTTQAQDGSNPTRVAPVKGIEVLAPHAGWIPTGGHLNLEVKFTLPPTSTRSQVEYVPLPPQPDITVTWSQPTQGSLSPLNSSTTVYTAPASIKHVSQVVVLSVKVKQANQDPYVTKADVHVIRRLWALTLGIVVDLRCEGSNKDFLVHYINSADQVFHMNDDLTLAVDRPPTFATAPPIVQTCDPACTPMVVASPSDLQPNVVAANFLLQNGFVLAGTASVANAIPTVYMKCEPDSASRTLEGAPYIQTLPGYFALSDSPQDSPRSPKGIPLWIDGTWQSIEK